MLGHMRHSLSILIAVLFATQTVSATEATTEATTEPTTEPTTEDANEATTEDCMAPNFKHWVVLFRDHDPDGGEYKLAIRVSNADKPIYSRLAGGYAAFSMATHPANFKCLWSSDSKFVAILERGTKRSGETSIYLVSGDKVQQVTFPDLMPLIRPYVTTGIRAFWVRPEVWVQDHKLILSVVFTQLDEKHAAYRFILTLQLRKTTVQHPVATIASFQQDKSFK